MKKYVAIAITSLILVSCIANKSTSITQKIDESISPISSNVNIGIIVQDKYDKIIYNKNSNNLFTPASTIKLFTAYATLNTLGQNFTYKTNIYVQNNLKHDMNDIYIKFVGDPSFTHYDLKNLISKIKVLNINKVDNIVIDDSYYDNQYIPDGRSTGDEFFCFASPISSITVNHNCFDVFIRHKDNKFYLESENDQLFKIKYFITNTNEKSNFKITYDGLVYNIDARINPEEIPKKISIAYQNPKLTIKNFIKYYFEFYNIRFNYIKFNSIPSGLEIHDYHESPPLSELITTMLKESDNLFADSFIKTLSREYYNKPGSMKDGINVIKEKLADKNVNFEEIRISDGSGLSYYNLISPRQMLNLLNAISKDDLFEEIYLALPIMGVDGTLGENSNSILKSKIFAKTGSLNSSINLAGYTDQELKFVIYFNHFMHDSKQIRNIRDKILKILINY